jgi:hypothetical protein
VGGFSVWPPTARKIRPTYFTTLAYAPSQRSAWQRRTNLWRERTNLRTGSERLRGIGPPVVVAPPPTDAEVVAGTILGIASMFARKALVMKKLLLASVLAIASVPGHAIAGDKELEAYKQQKKDFEQCVKEEGVNSTRCTELSDFDWDQSELQPTPKPPARVTVTPTYQGPPPIGWVYGPYTQCGNPPQCSMGVVNVQADGLNVRVAPNGPPVMSLVNGTPLIPLDKQGDWLLVAPACDLTPTWAWSWNAGVPLNRCWVYF